MHLAIFELNASPLDFPTLRLSRVCTRDYRSTVRSVIIRICLRLHTYTVPTTTIEMRLIRHWYVYTYKKNKNIKKIRYYLLVSSNY